MSDLDELEISETVKIVGSDSSGTESHPVEASSNNELFVFDVANNGGEDAILSLTAGQEIELKVGASIRSERKYIQIQALGRGIRFGFSSGSYSFKALKGMFFALPYGAGTSVWLKNESASTAEVAIAEVS